MCPGTRTTVPLVRISTQHSGPPRSFMSMLRRSLGSRADRERMDGPAARAACLAFGGRLTITSFHSKVLDGNVRSTPDAQIPSDCCLRARLTLSVLLDQGAEMGDLD